MHEELLAEITRRRRRADWFGWALRYGAAPVCFLMAAGTLSRLLNMYTAVPLPDSPLAVILARSSAAVLVALVLLALGHRFMSVSMAYGLRAGQLEDLTFVLYARKEGKQELATEILTMLVVLKRAAMSRVIESGAFIEEFKCLTAAMARLNVHCLTSPKKTIRLRSDCHEFYPAEPNRTRRIGTFSAPDLSQLA